VPEKVAADVFDQIETFARYGFNRAHSTCYALVAYQTGWLKRYYPKQFMAALMTSEISDTDRIYVLLEECRRLGIKVEPPDVNESRSDFSVIGDSVRFGLQAVKNVGGEAALAVMEARGSGERFASLADLVSRVPLKHVNRRTLEALIAAGACDSLPGNRAQKFDAVEAMLEYAHRVAEHSSSHDLFSGSGVEVNRVPPAFKDLPEWPTSHKLSQEKAMLGFYLTGHPLDKFRDELAGFATSSIVDLQHLSDGREVTVGGIVTAVKRMPDKKGNMMAFATVEDFTGPVELVCFSDAYDKGKGYIEIDKLVLVTGRLSTREGEFPKIIVSDILPLEKLSERFNCQLVIKIGSDLPETVLEQVFRVLDNSQGSSPVLLACRENGSEVYIKSRRYAVAVDFKLLESLKELLGDSSAYLRPLHAKNGET
ncbi:DNA polymerase III subunit alpha, partial [candidate division GN15 bacterium]